MGVVGISAGVADRPSLVDDVTARHRQRPAILAVRRLQVDSEVKVELLQILRDVVKDVEASREIASLVTEDGERKLPGRDQLQTLLPRLG